MTFNFNKSLQECYLLVRMSTHINLQHVFKMPASRTRARIETSLAYTSDVQRYRHGVRRSFKTWLHRIFFVEPGMKINGAYYRDVLLTQKLLPVIRQISGNEFVFQQDTAPSHRARETPELLRWETRRTLFHRNSGHRTVQILTQWTTKSWLQCSSASIKDSKCWRTATASAERLQQHWTRRYRHIRWLVACTTQSMHAFGRRTFWTHAVNLSA